MLIFAFALGACGEPEQKEMPDAVIPVEAPTGDFCEEGSQRVEACGEDGRGTQLETCVDGDWIADHCVEPHACLDNPGLQLACEEATPGGSVIGTRRGGCVDGEWVDELDEDGEIRCQLFSQIAASESAFCALRTTGEVFCWGSGSNYQTGRADASTSSVPTRVSGIDDAIAISGMLGQAFCALRSNGTVLCWGFARRNGQEIHTPTPSPVLYRETADAPPLPIADAIALDSGAYHSCVIRRSGGALCWGNNGGRRMGTSLVPNADDRAIAHPVQLDETVSNHLMGVQSIAAGRYSSCASLESGKVVCWGSNIEATFGSGAACPGQNHFPCGTFAIDDAVKVYTDGDAGLLIASCALHADGSLSCWGHTRYLNDIWSSNSVRTVPYKRIPVDHPLGRVVDLVLASHHACAIFEGGKLACWGGRWDGRLGLGDEEHRLEPELVLGVGGEGELEGVISVASRRAATCAVIDDGMRVACWGSDGSLELGHGGDHTITRSLVPRLIDWPVCQEGATRTVNCGLNGRGTVEQTCFAGSWTGTCVDPDECVNGSTTSTACISGGIEGVERQLCVDGQITSVQPGSAEPYPCETLESIGAGTEHSCALRTTGEVLCWGSNALGQLGIPGSVSSVPAEVSALSDIIELSVGANHNCALRSGGRVQCWGKGTDGALGHGSNANSSAPVFVLELSDAIAISAGDEHSCALRGSGEVACWGNGDDGRLGNGSTDSTNVPVTIDGISDAIAISAGGRHSCALRRGGEIVCWGHGAYGQLGQGSAFGALRPITVSEGELSGAIAISAGGRHSCAIGGDGAAFCWGAGELGQLGTGFASVHAKPVRVNFPEEALEGSALRVLEISAGVNHTCARLDTGSAWCWGPGNNGMLGAEYDAATTRALAPSRVRTSLGEEGDDRAWATRSISAGNAHSCAIVADPDSDELTGACTGAGGSGRLGTGETSNKYEMTPIAWP